MRNRSISFLLAVVVVSAMASKAAVQAPPQNVTVAAPNGAGDLTLTMYPSSEACNLYGVVVGPPPQPAPPGSLIDYSPAPNFSFPFGRLEFRTQNCAGSAPITFQLRFPKVSGRAVFFAEGYFGLAATDGSDTLTFTITDGSNWDRDRATDGSLWVSGAIGVQPTRPSPDYQDMWWAGAAENGWGMSIVQHDAMLFCVIFAYGDDGNPRWYVIPAAPLDAARKTASGSIYYPHGSPFTAYDASKFIPGDPVGTAHFTFDDNDHLTLSISIGNASAQKSLGRQGFGKPSTLVWDKWLGDMWWAGSAQNGWGIAVIQQYWDLFAVWFTYDHSGDPIWYVIPAPAWYGNFAFSGTLYLTTGSSWLHDYDPSRLTVREYGYLWMTFQAKGSDGADWATWKVSVGPGTIRDNWNGNWNSDVTFLHRQGF